MSIGYWGGVLLMALALLALPGCDRKDGAGVDAPAPSTPQVANDAPEAVKTEVEAVAPATPQVANDAPETGKTEVEATKVAALETVVTVNGVGISRQLLDGQVVMAEANRLIYGVEENSGSNQTESDPALQLQVLDNLINLELLCQEAIRRGYTPDPAEVDAALVELKSEYGGADDLLDSLSQSGLTEEDYRNQLIKTMALKKWQENDFLAQVKATEEEALAFYNQHQNLFQHGDLLRVSEIFINVPFNLLSGKQDEIKAKAREKAEIILKRIEAGQDFGALATEFSDSPEAKETRGDVGWVAKDKAWPQFGSTVAELQVNQVSPILDSPAGFYIFKVFEIKPTGVAPYESVKANIMEYIFSEKLEKVLVEKMAELRLKANINILDKTLKEAQASTGAAVASEQK